VLDAVARPGTIGERERERPVRLVLLERHSLRGHRMRGHRHSLSARVGCWFGWSAAGRLFVRSVTRSEN
jgi:hypothetical protein